MCKTKNLMGFLIMQEEETGGFVGKAYMQEEKSESLVGKKIVQQEQSDKLVRKTFVWEGKNDGLFNNVFLYEAINGENVAESRVEKSLHEDMTGEYICLVRVTVPLRSTYYLTKSTRIIL